jgi:hypothetical protein
MKNNLQSSNKSTNQQINKSTNQQINKSTKINKINNIDNSTKISLENSRKLVAPV